ncbi:MAG: Kef-type K+ transport system membrane component KefB [Pirellulaceae bacterium]
MHETNAEQVVLIIGVALCAALLAGIVAKWTRLPKVTAFLFAGLLLGPHAGYIVPAWTVSWVPEWISGQWPIIRDEHHSILVPIGDFAMALVLFSMGCRFTLVHFRKILPRVARLSFGELGLTFMLVTTGLIVMNAPWQLAILFGALAMATAPATTLLVIKENNSEGPVTDFAGAMIAVNNLVCIVAFEVLFMFWMYSEGLAKAPLLQEFGYIALRLASAMALGVVGGIVITYCAAFLARSRWLILVVAVTGVLLGTCWHFDLSYLLAFLAMGVTVANLSDFTDEIEDEMGHFTGMLCVVFFITHGAELDLSQLVAAGGVGVGYIVFRLLGKYFGVWMAADVHRDGPLVKRWLGATLLSQAGAAIALSTIAVSQTVGTKLHGDALKLQTVILGTVVFFEIVGPIMIRWSLLKSGEVPFSHAISHSDRTLLGELKAMINRGLLAIGINPWQRISTEELQIEPMMQRNFKTLDASATFKKTVNFIEQSRDNTYTVVAEDGAIVGIIRFGDLRDEHFDPELGGLVRAIDLARQTFPRLFPDQPIAEAWAAFRDNNYDVLPVISRQAPHPVVGMIRRRDIVSMLAVQNLES